MDDDDLDLAVLVALGADAVTRRVLERLEAAGHVGVRPSHGYVIQRLLAGEPTISELAAALGMTQQGASKHVAELERLGLAERTRDAADQRARRVRLTSAGRDVVTTARTARREIDHALESRLGSSDVAAARRVLTGLLEVTGDAERVRSRTMPLPES